MVKGVCGFSDKLPDDDTPLDNASANRLRDQLVQVRNVEETVMRLRSQQLLTPLHMSKSFEMEYSFASDREWRTRTKLREVYSQSTTQKILKRKRGWHADVGKVSKRVKVCCKDNCDFYQRHASRVEAGERIKSRVINTVTGESFPVQLKTVEGIEPGIDDSVWDCEEPTDLATLVPVQKTELDAKVQAVWLKHVAVVKADPQALLLRPPPECDGWDGSSGRQILIHEPVLMNVGTATTSDCQTIADDLIARDPDKMIIIACDQQTQKNLWEVFSKDKEKYKRCSVIPGELHNVMAAEDFIFVLNWTYILEPIALLLGGLRVHARPFKAAEHSEKQRLLFLVQAAGIKWLTEVGVTERDLNDIPKFLKAIKKNKPVHDFIFYLFYFGAPYLEQVNALRTTDVDYLDWIWRYNLFGLTAAKKTNYKILTLCFLQVSILLACTVVLMCFLVAVAVEFSPNCAKGVHRYANLSQDW